MKSVIDIQSDGHPADIGTNLLCNGSASVLLFLFASHAPLFHCYLAESRSPGRRLNALLGRQDAGTRGPQRRGGLTSTENVPQTRSRPLTPRNRRSLPAEVVAYIPLQPLPFPPSSGQAAALPAIGAIASHCTSFCKCRDLSITLAIPRGSLRTHPEGRRLPLPITGASRSPAEFPKRNR